MTLGQSQEMTLTLNTHIPLFTQSCCLHLPTFKSMFPVEKPKFWKWPCRKIGQVQPMVIIFYNYNGQDSPMLHTKFHGNLSTGSGRRRFLKGFTIYGHGGHFEDVTSIKMFPLTKEAHNFLFLYVSESLHIKFDL